MNTETCTSSVSLTQMYWMLAFFFFSSKIYCNVAETHIHTHTSEVGKAVNACAVIKDEQAKWRRCYTFVFYFWETCFSSY